MTNLAEQIAEARAAANQGGKLVIGQTSEPETGDGWLLNVVGSELEAWWPAEYVPEDGDPVLAVQIGETWHVVGPVVSSPSPVPPVMGRVKTVSTGASRITVTVGGTDMELAFLDSYTPVVGHDVALLWQDGYEDALVLGRRGSVPRPKPPKPSKPKPKPSNPKPPKKRRGRTTFAATDGGPWSATAGGWSSTAGRNIIQGSWGGLSYDGFWFYGTKIRNALKGSKVTKAEIYLPNRLRMGSYNSSATAQLRRHTSSASSRPGSKPSQSGSSTNISIPRIGSARGWVTIPTSIAQAIVDSGGGIALVGNTYLGFPGPGSGSGRNPRSGSLRISWEK